MTKSNFLFVGRSQVSGIQRFLVPELGQTGITAFDHPIVALIRAGYPQRVNYCVVRNGTYIDIVLREHRDVWRLNVPLVLHTLLNEDYEQRDRREISGREYAIDGVTPEKPLEVLDSVYIPSLIKYFFEFEKQNPGKIGIYLPGGKRLTEDHMRRILLETDFDGDHTASPTHRGDAIWFHGDFEGDKLNSVSIMDDQVQNHNGDLQRLSRRDMGLNNA